MERAVPYFDELSSDNNKHLLVFLAPNIIFIGQMEKILGEASAESNIFLQLTNEYDIR